MIGTWQLILILIIALVLFGAGRIPRIMRDLGLGLKAFKEGIEGAEDDVDKSNNVKTATKTLNTKNKK